MHSAIAAVLDGKMSRCKAAKEFGVSKTTLINRLDAIDRHQPPTTSKLSHNTMIDAAVEAAKTGKMSARRAAKVFRVPERTVHYRLQGRGSKAGKPMTFSDEEESTIVEILLKLSKLNAGLTRRGLVEFLEEIGERKGTLY